MGIEAESKTSPYSNACFSTASGKLGLQNAGPNDQSPL